MHAVVHTKVAGESTDACVQGPNSRKGQQVGEALHLLVGTPVLRGFLRGQLSLSAREMRKQLAPQSMF
jgi:hypothetical protein